jgi:uncharacterized lipoprotein YmbA
MNVRGATVLVLSTVLAAGACGAVLPKSKPSEFYVLTAREPVTRAEPAPGAPSVLLAPVVLPPYLDRRELVTRLGPNQVRVEDLELWAEPLRQSVPATLERDLAARLGGARVAKAPWTGTAPPDVVVSVELRRFERTSNRTVELEAVWTIVGGGGGGVRARRDTRLALAVPSPSTGAAVTVMSDALASLSREIAAALSVSGCRGPCAGPQSPAPPPPSSLGSRAPG